MARTVTPGKTWRDLPPSPPVGVQTAEDVPPPPEPPPPPDRFGRGFWGALGIALGAVIAIAVVLLLWMNDDDGSEIVGAPDAPAVEADPDPSAPADRLDEFFGQFGEDLPEGLDEFFERFEEDLPEGFGEFFEQFPEGLENLPEDLDRLLPPDLLGDLENFFEGGELPELFDRFGGEFPGFDPDELRRFFDEFGEALPEFDFEEFFADPDGLPFPPRDFSFEFGDGRLGLNYVPEGYRVAGSSAGASTEGGEVRAMIEVRLAGPQGPATVRAEVGVDAADMLADAPGEPIRVRGGQGKLSDDTLSFADGDVFVTITAEGDLSSNELILIAEHVELAR